MSTVVDLDNERELNALTNKLGRIISGNPECVERTFAALSGELEMKEETCLLSVRVSKALADQIDEIARELAFNEKRKVTRSALVTTWLVQKVEEHSHVRLDET